MQDLWLVDGKMAGYVTTSGTLTFLTVLGAGHFVPADQGPNSLDMIQRFINKQPYCNPQVDFLSQRSSFVRGLLVAEQNIERDVAVSQVSCRVGPALCAIRECNGKGTCMAGTGNCKCDDGFTGPDCSFAIKSVSSTPFEENRRFIAQQEWIYYTASIDSKNPVVDIRVTQNVDPTVPFDGDDRRFTNTIGGGIGGTQPQYGLCLYGRIDTQPTTHNFDFVKCVIGKSPLAIRANANPANNPTPFYFGVFNAHPYNLTFDIGFETGVDETGGGSSAVFTSWKFWLPMGISIALIVTLVLATVFLVVQNNRLKRGYHPYE